MTEIEVPIEKVQEDIHHQALHGSGHDAFIGKCALLSAVLAVLAALSALFAGHYANEAMLEQIQSSDSWAYYQAKGIKAAVAGLRAEITKDPKAEEKALEYKKEQDEIKVEAEKKAVESKLHLHKHENLATSVTFFQVAIAMTAISVLTRKRRFLSFAFGLGIFGAIWMIFSFIK